MIMGLPKRLLDVEHFAEQACSVRRMFVPVTTTTTGVELGNSVGFEDELKTEFECRVVRKLSGKQLITPAAVVWRTIWSLPKDGQSIGNNDLLAILDKYETPRSCGIGSVVD